MRLAEQRRKSQGRAQADLAEVVRKINRMLKMVEDGHAEPAIAGPRLNELAAERRTLEEAVSNEPSSKVIEIFPNAAARYAAKVAEIHTALANGKTGELEAVELVRALIRRIVVRSTPAPQPLAIEVEGTLAILLQNEGGHMQSDIVRPDYPHVSAISP